MPIGTLNMHDGELSVLYEFDFTDRHELKTGGETITGVPTVAVLQAGVPSAEITVAGIAVVGGKKVQFRLTDAGATVGEIYEVRCTVVLSGGATLIECGTLTVTAC